MLENKENIFKINQEKCKVSEDIFDIISSIKSLKYYKYIEEQFLEHRRQIIDWMMLVSKKLNFLDCTYFISVEIFDTFLENQVIIDIDFFLVLAISSLILASKYNELNFLGIEFGCKCLANNKIKNDQLKEMELKVLCILNFRIKNNYFEEFIYSTIVIFDRNLTIERKRKLKISEKFEKIFKICIFLYKMIIQNYSFYRKKHQLTLYFSILMFSLNNELGLNDIKFDDEIHQQFFEIAKLFKILTRKIEKYILLLQSQVISFLNGENVQYNNLFNIEWNVLIEI